MTKLVLILGMMIWMGGCANRVHEFLGPVAVEVLSKPDRVEAWRIDKARVEGAHRAVDVAIGKRVGEVLLDSRTYDFDSAKGCLFDPGVGYRIWRGTKSVDVILCFHCNEFKIISVDEKDGKTEDFDRARGRLVGIVKETFPADAEIGKLER